MKKLMQVIVLIFLIAVVLVGSRQFDKERTEKAGKTGMTVYSGLLCDMMDKSWSILEDAAKSWYEAVEIVSQIRQYIDSVSAQIDTDYGSNEMENENPILVYEKYFQLKQGELTRICGIEDMSECWRTSYIDSHFTFPAIAIDRNLYVQYTNIFDICEDELPRNILITGSNIDLGFMGARAGMNLQEIQENAYEKEIQEGFMYTEDWQVHYIEYTDGFYDYIYYSDYPDGKNAWLIICKP